MTGVGAATFALAGGSINLHAGSGLLVGATAGAFLGARLILRISHQLLRWLFVAILVATGVKLLIDAAQPSAVHAATTVPPMSVIANPWYAIPTSLILGSSSERGRQEWASVEDC